MSSLFVGLLLMRMICLTLTAAFGAGLIWYLVRDVDALT